LTYLIYGLGGGWGHLNRCLSLAQLLTKKTQVQLIINSPYFPYINNYINQLNQINIFFLNSQENINLITQQIRTIILKNDYNCLIVDTFPRGLGGELTQILSLLTVKKILIHRDLNPRYIKLKNIEEFVKKNYDLILIPEKGNNLPFANFPNSHFTPPWLIKNSDQLIPKNQAYSLLKINKLPEQKVIIILASGQIEELEIYGEIANLLSSNTNYTIRMISPIKPKNCPPKICYFYYPAIDLLPIADLVIGGGGYNTISEVIALNIPLIVLPQPRLYDRQLMRIKRIIDTGNNQIKIATNLKQVMTEANYLLQNLKFKPNFNYKNGVLEAITLIENL